MSTYTFPTAAALRADALADFRVEVERLSQAIDWERVTYRRARCERFNHVLGGPELHYRKHTGDRGRWFIEASALIKCAVLERRANRESLSAAMTIRATFKEAGVSLSLSRSRWSRTSCSTCAISRLQGRRL